MRKLTALCESNRKDCFIYLITQNRCQYYLAHSLLISIFGSNNIYLALLLLRYTISCFIASFSPFFLRTSIMSRRRRLVRRTDRTERRAKLDRRLRAKPRLRGKR